MIAMTYKRIVRAWDFQTGETVQMNESGMVLVSDKKLTRHRPDPSIPCVLECLLNIVQAGPACAVNQSA